MKVLQRFRATSVVRFLVAIFIIASVSVVSESVDAETVTYYYTNQQGTPLATADAEGSVTSVADYRSFGTQVLGTPEASPGYTGHVNDPSSGLVYMQARYYDPQVGRFLSVDPVQGRAGDLSAVGAYTYAKDNPLLNVDPDGRQAFAGWSESQIHAVAQNPGVGEAYTDVVVTSLPVIGDASNVAQAIREPSTVNIVAAVVGFIPDGGGPAAKIFKLGTSGGKRAAKAFTRAGKAEVKEANAAAHEGKIVCEACGRDTVPAQQSQKGVTPPDNEAHVDHIVPMSKNGDGSPSNGQVLCRGCNLEKSDK